MKRILSTRSAVTVAMVAMATLTSGYAQAYLTISMPDFTFPSPLPLPRDHVAGQFTGYAGVMTGNLVNPPAPAGVNPQNCALLERHQIQGEIMPGWDGRVYATTLPGYGIRFQVRRVIGTGSDTWHPVPAGGVYEHNFGNQAVTPSPGRSQPLGIRAEIVKSSHPYVALAMPTINSTYATVPQRFPQPLDVCPADSQTTVSKTTTITPLTDQIKLMSCTVQTPSLNVDLGKVESSKFTGVGSRPGNPKEVTLKFLCDPGIKVNMTVTDTLSPAGAANYTNTLTTVDEVGAAKGVGVQLSYMGFPQNLGFDSALPNNRGQFQVGSTSPTSPPNTPREATLQFRYIQTTAKVTPGKVKAYATFTMSYQ